MHSRLWAICGEKYLLRQTMIAQEKIGISIHQKLIDLKATILVYYSSIVVLLLISLTLSAVADNLEPEYSLLPTSAKQAFIMDAQLPSEYWGALDERRYVAITGLFIGEKMFAAGGQSLMSRPDRVCSIYDTAICFDINRFYSSSMPQILVSGFLMLDGSDAITFGIDTGYASPKLKISPSILLGLSKRWFTSEKRDAHFIVEASGWLGQSVSHEPCYDAYNRGYYCGNLSAWSDFTYDAHPTNLYIKLWYEKAF